VSVKNNQIEVPFTTDNRDKLDGIAPGAEPQPAIASQAEAEAGTDNVKMMTALRVSQELTALGAGEANTADNLGSGAGVFAQKTGVDLQFKSFVAGAGVTIVPGSDTITISASTSAETNSYLNNSGFTIPEFTLVRQDSSGNINTINPSSESQVSNVLGILLQNTNDGQYGTIALLGLITNVITSFVLGDVLYLSKSGGLTTTIPEIGAGGFLASDFVVKVGRITKNLDNPLNIDLKVEIDIIGQL
jgi:hypothetical protein